jgi:hypothetical protein
MITSQIHDLKVQLTRWREITARDFPVMLNSILPQLNDINLEKLGDNGSVMTDTCNGAQKNNLSFNLSKEKHTQCIATTIYEMYGSKKS